jgi:adenylate kinase family enzyme
MPASPPASFQRVAVIGSTGCGKTTLAKALAKRLGAPHIELDSFYWEANWHRATRDDFRARVEKAVAAPMWVADGNYSRARDLIWGRATALVWLDYSRPLILWRLARRTSIRLFKREVLWNDNRERVFDIISARDSLLAWARQNHPSHHSEYPALLATPEYNHLHAVRLVSPKEAEHWLEAVPAST